MDLTHEQCLVAVRSRDTRFDGWFFSAVRTTGIYCRPSCPAVTPHSQHVEFFPSAGAAQHSGYRACKRCRPDASPGSPEWNHRSDLVARAVRLIHDGFLDRGTVAELAAELGYSARQLERQISTELGVGPIGLARSERAQTARTLIESTTLPITDIAFAAGFSSVRNFNDTIRSVFASTPTELRRRRRAGADSSISAGIVSLRLAVRQPFNPSNLFADLAATAVPGVESWEDGWYRRTMSLPHGSGVLSLRPAGDHVAARLRLSDNRDLSAAVSRARWLLDLDADPKAVDAHLAADPAMAPLVASGPGRRVPRTVDGAEFTIRTVLGQQVSTAAARTLAGRLVRAHGEPLADPDGELTHLFPPPTALREVDPESLAMPHNRRRTLLAVSAALADGSLNCGPGADWAAARARLDELPGCGPWTVGSISMRSLGDPDAFLPTDLGVVRAAENLGLGSKRVLLDRADRWRPWRAYAVQYLWASLPHPINDLPIAPEES